MEGLARVEERRTIESEKCTLVTNPSLSLERRVSSQREGDDEELRQRDINFLLQLLDRTKKENVQLREENKELRQKNESLIRSYEDLDLYASKQKRKKTVIREEYEKIHRTCENVVQKNTRLSKENQDLHTTRDELAQQNMILAAANVRLEEERGETQEKGQVIELLRRQIAELQTDLAFQTETTAQLRSSSKSLSEERGHLLQVQTEMKKELQKCDTAVTEIKAHLLQVCDNHEAILNEMQEDQLRLQKKTHEQAVLLEDLQYFAFSVLYTINSLRSITDVAPLDRDATLEILYAKEDRPSRYAEWSQWMQKYMFSTLEFKSAPSPTNKDTS